MKRLVLPSWFVVPALLAAGIAAYGVFATRLGYYWDDWGFAWISRTYGNPGLERYFSTNRPVWGWFYQLTTPWLGQHILTWQVLALLTRWAAAVIFWRLLLRIWSERTYLAAAAAFFFMLYPGFGQHPIALMYTHFYLVLILALLSLLLMIWSVQGGEGDSLGKHWGIYLLSLVMAGLHLFAMEYFFGLELLRPLLLFLLFSREQQNFCERIKKLLRVWLPYAVILGMYVYWRVAIHTFRTYQPELLTATETTSAWQGILEKAAKPFIDLFTATIQAWGQVFWLPGAAFGRLSTIGWVMVVAAGTAGSLFVFWRMRLDSPRFEKKSWLAHPAVAACGAVLLCSVPFWVANLPVYLRFPNDRFTLPLSLGAALLLAGLLDLLRRPRGIQILLTGVFIGLSIGWQFRNGTAYSRDWDLQKTFFWQLAWRAPYLAPQTTLLSEDLPFAYESDNSLTAPLNWMYAPENRSTSMSYILYTASVRAERTLAGFAEHTPFTQNYLTALFSGNTSQVVVFTFQPPACLHMLDPRRDTNYPLLPPLLKKALPLSDLSLIQPVENAVQPLEFFDSEPAHGWCYYYLKAELARQAGEFTTAARLGDAAFATGDHYNDAAELLVFIEAYARTAQWKKAEKLTLEALDVTPLMQPMLCNLWNKMGSSPQAGEMLQTLTCAPGN